MRHPIAALMLLLSLAVPALAAGPAPKADAAKAESAKADAPKAADVREYIRLFGYRQMLESQADLQLDAVIDAVRESRADLDPGMLDIIHQELRTEFRAASEKAVEEMVAVFQRHLSREDVAYLIGVGRDARMQKVVRLQPRIAEDMEGIGERLANEVTVKAAPRIQERLKQLQGGQRL